MDEKEKEKKSKRMKKEENLLWAIQKTLYAHFCGREWGWTEKVASFYENWKFVVCTDR